MDQEKEKVPDQDEEENDPMWGKLHERWRIEKGLSRQQIVEGLQHFNYVCDQSTIYKYERKFVHPSGEYLAYLAVAFCIPDDEVYLWLEVMGIEYEKGKLDEYRRVICRYRK